MSKLFLFIYSLIVEMLQLNFDADIESCNTNFIWTILAIPQKKFGDRTPKISDNPSLLLCLLFAESNQLLIVIKYAERHLGVKKIFLVANDEFYSSEKSEFGNFKIQIYIPKCIQKSPRAKLK